MKKTSKKFFIIVAIIGIYLAIDICMYIWIGCLNESCAYYGDVLDTHISHNEKFTIYEGRQVRGTTINALLKNVLNNNLTNDDDSMKVFVNDNTDKTASLIVDDNPILGTEATAITKVNSSYTYKVECNYNETTDLIESISVIKIQENKGE